MTEKSLFEQRLERGCTGRKAEKRGGKRIGAQVNAGSGALDGLKGDLTTDEFLIESKSTQKASMSLKLDWLRKIQREALEKTKNPALMLQFTDSNGEVVQDGSWIAVPEWLWLELFSE